MNNTKLLHMRGGQKVLSPNILDYNFFHNLYISEKCILGVCCGYDVVVIYDDTALNGNDLKHQQKHLKSFIIVHSRYTNDQIFNFKTDNSHWGSGYYFLQSGLGVRKYTHEQPAG